MTHVEPRMKDFGRSRVVDVVSQLYHISAWDALWRTESGLLLQLYADVPMQTHVDCPVFGSLPSIWTASPGSASCEV